MLSIVAFLFLGVLILRVFSVHSCDSIRSGRSVKHPLICIKLAWYLTSSRLEKYSVQVRSNLCALYNSLPTFLNIYINKIFMPKGFRIFCLILKKKKLQIHEIENWNILLSKQLFGELFIYCLCYLSMLTEFAHHLSFKCIFLFFCFMVLFIDFINLS